MKPPAIDRIRIEDYPDAPEWFEGVIESWNGFVESTVQILSNRVTFFDNFDGQEYEDDISQQKLDAGYRIRVTMKQKPRGVIPLQIYKIAGTHEPFTTAPFVDWTYADGLITIHAITGIDSSSTYRVRLQIV